jgi:hypothetical protein
VWRDRIEDYLRHVVDLQNRAYEGVLSREDRERAFLSAFDITTPVAQRILMDTNAWFLCGTGKYEERQPARDGDGGIRGAWTMDWPLLQADRNRLTGGRLPAVRIIVAFPQEWTHPHLVLVGADGEVVFAWPFQVASSEDAERQEPIMRAVVEAELHDRIFLARSNWAVLPLAHSGELGHQPTG